jgi:hypothetical protein
MMMPTRKLADHSRGALLAFLSALLMLSLPLACPPLVLAPLQRSVD